MKIFTAGKNPAINLTSTPSETEGRDGFRQRKKLSRSGNIFFALFAAVAMVGAVGVGFNSVLKGPISSMTDATRRTVAESTVVTSARVAIVAAATQQADNGDCDADGSIEPMPFRDAAGKPAPTGGGYLPTGLIPNSIDPWGTEYGYCAWDTGTKIADAGCGGATGRLAGSPHNNQYAIAIVSAGRDKVFQTRCNAYADTTPVDQLPDTPLIVRAAKSDDIVLGYTYAEANNLGNGLWSPKTATEAETSKGIAAKGATFTDGIDLMKGGLKLPTDDGSDSTTGACNSANDRQMRLNTSTVPPTLEICDDTGGLGWSALSGGAGVGGAVLGTMVSRWKLDEASGTVAADSVGTNNGEINSGPIWRPTDGRLQGGLDVSSGVFKVLDDPSMRPTAVTLSTWFKLSKMASGSSSGWLLKKNTGTVPKVSYGFYAPNPNRIAFYIGTASGGYLLSAPMTTNTWTHLAGTYDPVVGRMEFYVNGLKIASRGLALPILYDTGHMSNINGGLGFWLDDVRLYNYALSAAEIQKMSDVSEPGSLTLLAPNTAGRLLGWGTDTNAAQGNGTNAAQVTAPFALPNGLNFVQASAAISHGCGVKSDGKVWCWGEQNYGKLGTGTAVNAQEMVQVSQLKNIVKVSAGADHNCALDKNGRVWCWGRTDNGRLGNGTTSAGSTDIPQPVSNYEDFIDIAAGYTSTCGIRKDNTVWCWGRGDSGQLGIGSSPVSQGTPAQVTAVTGFTQIDASQSSNTYCGTVKSGKGYCWGNETNGELGNGAPSSQQNTPNLVLDVEDFVKIETEGTTSCGLRAGGEIWCWGNDSYGALGNGTSQGNTLVPLKVVNVSDFIDVAAGVSMGCGIRQNHDLWCWGRDDTGQLGTGMGDQSSHVPLQALVRNVTSISMGTAPHLAIVDEKPLNTMNIDAGRGKIAVGYNFTCMIKKDATAWCWGLDTQGVLGNGSLVTADQDRPSMVTDPGPWLQLETGGSGNSVCGIKRDGMMWCWGMDNTGQLGTSASNTSQHSPVPSTDTSYWGQLAVGSGGGGGHTCGIRGDGTLWCWGSNSNGRTGLGSTSGSTDLPAQVSTDIWTDVGAGFSSTCGVKADGTGWCWGQNSTSGELGLGNSTAFDYSTPQQIADPGPWAMIRPMANFSCGIKRDGTLWCWGSDGTHTIGNGNDVLSGDPNVPTKVHSAQLWSSISVGHTYVCGLDITGSAWCWGSSSNYETGVGVSTVIQTPARVFGGIKFTALEAMGDHTCGIDIGGNAWCWGDDANGKLGNGPAVTAQQPQPYPVATTADPWIWDNTGTAFSPPPGYNPSIGNTRWIAPDTTASQGFNFESGGKSRIVQTTTGNQLLVEATGNNNSSQLSFAAGGAVSSTDVTSGLVTKYTLDASSGTTVTDSVGGVNATTNGTVTWQPAGGKVAGSLNFSGTAYAEAPRNSILEPTSFTWSFWMKPNAISASDLLAKLDLGMTVPTVGVSYAFSLTGSKEISFVTGYNGSFDVLGSQPVASVGEWIHVTGVYDPPTPGSAASKRLYINGRLVASNKMKTPIYYNTDPSNGAFQLAKNFNGALDDVRLYNRGLDENEIAALYYYTSQDKVTFSMGLDANTGSLKFARNNNTADATLDNLPSDMEIAVGGNVGVGTDGAPMALLDVNGAVKVGNDAGGCTSGKAGTIKYTGGTPPWEYCDGSWKPFGTFGAGVTMSGQFWDTAWSSISVGDVRGCAIKGNGTLWCWGEGASGGLGNNNVADALTPVQVHSDSSSAGWNDWKMISANGYRSACGIRTNGTMWCWGSATHGQLGNGIGVGDFLRPVQVKDDAGTGTWSDWVSVSSAHRTACGIRANGTLWCWGSSGDGMIGNNQSAANYSLPVQVHSDSSSTGWSDWILISLHQGSACGIRSNGTAWCWGLGDDGSLGNNTSGSMALRPVQVMDSTATGTWSDWKSISAGFQTNCGVRSNGTAWCWGNANNGKHGNNDTTSKMVPTQVHTDTGPGSWSDWVNIEVGHINVCGLRVNGSAWCWGNQFARGNGNNSTAHALRPVRVMTDTAGTGWDDWASISAGYTNTCGIRTNGTLWCWGTPSNGALGDGQTATQRLVPYPVVMP